MSVNSVPLLSHQLHASYGMLILCILSSMHTLSCVKKSHPTMAAESALSARRWRRRGHKVIMPRTSRNTTLFLRLGHGPHGLHNYDTRGIMVKLCLVTRTPQPYFSINENHSMANKSYQITKHRRKTDWSMVRVSLPLFHISLLLLLLAPRRGTTS